jgi:hypothetical protein
LALLVYKLGYFWFPHIEPKEGVLGKLNIIAIWVLTLRSVPGPYLIHQKQRWAGRFLLSGMLLYPAIYSVAPIEPPYRYLILWMTVFLLRGGEEALRRWHGGERQTAFFAGQDAGLVGGFGTSVTYCCQPLPQLHNSFPSRARSSPPRSQQAVGRHVIEFLNVSA